MVGRVDGMFAGEVTCPADHIFNCARSAEQLGVGLELTSSPRIRGEVKLSYTHSSCTIYKDHYENMGNR